METKPTWGIRHFAAYFDEVVSKTHRLFFFFKYKARRRVFDGVVEDILNYVAAIA